MTDLLKEIIPLFFNVSKERPEIIYFMPAIFVISLSIFGCFKLATVGNEQNFKLYIIFSFIIMVYLILLFLLQIIIKKIKM